MTGHISDRETAPEIRCRLSSIMRANISDGNTHSQPAYMNVDIERSQDGQRPQIRGSSVSNIHVLVSCTSRVVSNSARDPLYSELIHSAVCEVSIHASTPRPLNDHPQVSYHIDRFTHTTIIQGSVYKKDLQPTKDTSSSIERSGHFLD